MVTKERAKELRVFAVIALLVVAIAIAVSCITRRVTETDKVSAIITFELNKDAKFIESVRAAAAGIPDLKIKNDDFLSIGDMPCRSVEGISHAFMDGGGSRLNNNPPYDLELSESGILFYVRANFLHNVGSASLIHDLSPDEFKRKLLLDIEACAGVMKNRSQWQYK